MLKLNVVKQTPYKLKAYAVPEAIKGDKGDKGDRGEKGNDALINGYNTVEIKAGKNISINQDGNVLNIVGTYEFDDETIQEHLKSLNFVTDEQQLEIGNLNVSVASINEDIQQQEENINFLADTKQEKLTAGSNITIDKFNVISATSGGSSYDDTEIWNKVNLIDADLGTVQEDVQTRMTTDMENIDEIGIAYINSLIDAKVSGALESEY